MKKQNFKSLTLKKRMISNFSIQEIQGGISGHACGSKKACQQASVVHTCQYSDLRTCTNSIINCAE
ncbi:hypothetical protein [Kordia sp.]|uniref:hypothetical protein n=1 Tax=Kordia sp. TaxID=1965332 RepID=UPI003B59C9C8